jgi:chromate reductase
MATTRIAVIVGSLSRESINRRLAQALIELAPSDFSLRVLRIDDLPLYNRDDDATPTEAVKRLKREVADAQGVLFVTPEYNRSIPGPLKNTLDHGSRPYGHSVWAGKPVGVVGASTGAPGASMAQQHLRNILAYLDMPTLGQPEVYLQVTKEMFDSEGRLAKADTEKFLRSWMDRFVSWVRDHAGQPVAT